MSRTLFSLAGFQVIISGRFWVIAEAISFTYSHKQETAERISECRNTLECRITPRSFEIQEIAFLRSIRLW